MSARKAVQNCFIVRKEAQIFPESHVTSRCASIIIVKKEINEGQVGATFRQSISHQAVLKTRKI